jgi:hypothetical protein
MRARSLPLFAALGALLTAPPVSRAQEATSVQTIRTWVDHVKLDGGVLATWTYTVTYDLAEGLYAVTARDASGAVVSHQTSAYPLAAPSTAEVERARAIILADPELRAVYDAAPNPQLEGGFVLLREPGHPCGPGARCLQFDLYDVDHAARRVERLRFVVVDLRTGALVSRDFDPAVEGNETRFNRDRR